VKGEQPYRQVGSAAVDAAAATTGGSLLVGGLWSGASRLIPQLYTLAVSVAAARFLGADGFGRQSYIAFVELSVIMLFTGGVPIALMRYVGETLGRGRAGAVHSLLWWAWRIEAVVAVAGGGLLVAAALLGADPRSAWLLAALACALGVLHTVPSSVLIGAQRWREASIVGLVSGAFATGATVVVLAAGGGITGMFAVEVAASAVNLAWTSVLARRLVTEIAPVREPAGDVESLVLRYAGLASIGVVLTFVVWRRSEFFFLERYSTDAQIALYSIAFAVVTALGRIFEAIATVVSPAVATLLGAGQTDRIRVGYGRAFRLLVVVSLPITAIGLALGPTALRLLYGGEFAGTGPVLVLMLLTFPVVALVRTSNALLHGLGRLRFLLTAGFVAAVANIGLAFLLVPRHDAVGAAIANGCAQLAVAVPVLVYATRITGPLRWDAPVLLRAALASAGAGLAGWAGVALVDGALGLALGSALAAGALALLATALRVVPAEDAAWLEAAAGDRLGGVFGRVCRLCAERPRGEPAPPPTRA
jgi:O-antigen/teichoic acid export membrane protein